MTKRRLVVSILNVQFAVLAAAFASAQPAQPQSKAAIFGYVSKDGVMHLLKSGESFRETRYAVDVLGSPRSIGVEVSCGEGEASITNTMEHQPVAIWILKHTQAAVALRAGDSVQDTFAVRDAANNVIELPVTVSCRDHGKALDLEINATLDGQKVEFYVGGPKTGIYALKPGEHISGTSRIKVRPGWYYTDQWYTVVGQQD
jgi:hypothetical protein